MEVSRLLDPRRDPRPDRIQVHVGHRGHQRFFAEQRARVEALLEEVPPAVVLQVHLDLGLGAYPEVSLKEARRLATSNRALTKGGFDPRHEGGRATTFAEANDEYLRWKWFPAPVAGNRLSNQRYKWDCTMRKHVLPRIGSVPVAEVTTRQAAAIASAMIDTPSAKFALSCIERVCQWAIDSGHREKANPASGPKR